MGHKRRVAIIINLALIVTLKHLPVTKTYFHHFLIHISYKSFLTTIKYLFNPFFNILTF